MSSESDSWFHNLSSVINFTKGQQAVILLISTSLIASLFYFHDEIDDSNILVMIFELAFAGMMGFILAKYYFNKDRNLRKRELQEQRLELKNDFEHRLRVIHVRMLQEMNRTVDNLIPQFSLRRLDSLLTEAILSFNNFEPTDIDSSRELNNALMRIKKHSEVKMDDDTLMMDLKLALGSLEKVGQKYHIDLTPV